MKGGIWAHYGRSCYVPDAYGRTPCPRTPRCFKKLLNPTMTIQLNPETGETTLTWNLPPEEQVESAAARVRPLILNDEDTYHAKVMNAISYFANKAKLPEVNIESIRVLKQQQWAKVNPKAESNGYYEVRVQMNDEPETQIGDNALAFSWIYGDVVHADPERRAQGQIFGVDERYRAAVPVVVRLLMLAMTTLTFIETLHANGTIPDLGKVFDEDVVYDEARSAVRLTCTWLNTATMGVSPRLLRWAESSGKVGSPSLRFSAHMRRHRSRRAANR